MTPNPDINPRVMDDTFAPLRKCVSFDADRIFTVLIGGLLVALGIFAMIGGK